MGFCRVFRISLATVLLASALRAPAQAPAQSCSSSSSSPQHVRSRTATPDSSPDAGEVRDSVYQNKNPGFSLKIPAGWVLRTEDMNARDEQEKRGEPSGEQEDASVPPTSKGAGSEQSQATGDGKVLLAAFSRPPEATAEDVNSSILIAEESVAAYPGLKEAGQYLGPIAEVVKAQGFRVVNEPYEFMVGTSAGTKTLAREDFQKDVGTRVLRQSTLVMLARGCAVSFTFIGGTEEEVDGLIQGLSFKVSRNAGQ